MTARDQADKRPKLAISFRSLASLGLTLLTRGLAAIGGIWFSVIVARIGGAYGLGNFTAIQSGLMIIALLIRFGTDQSFIRLVSTERVNRSNSQSFDFFIKAGFYCLALSLSFAFCIYFTLGKIELPPGYLKLGAILCWALPGLTLVNMCSGYIKGYRFSAVAALAEIGAISGIAAIFASILALQSLEAIAQTFVVVANIVAVIAIIFSIILSKILRPETSEKSPPQAGVATSFQKFLLGGWPFTIVALSVLVTQSGAFAIGSYVLGQESLGLLRAAERLAMIIGFSLTAINPFIAPRIAAAWTKNGAMGVRRTYKKAVVASIITALPLAILLVIFGESLLRYFGEEFAAAYPVMLIMAAGQLVRASVGSQTMVLTMTGREQYAMRISVFTLLAGAMQLYIGGLYFGYYGFAVAYSLTIIEREALMYYIIRRKIFG